MTLSALRDASYWTFPTGYTPSTDETAYIASFAKFQTLVNTSPSFGWYRPGTGATGPVKGAGIDFLRMNGSQLNPSDWNFYNPMYRPVRDAFNTLDIAYKHIPSRYRTGTELPNYRASWEAAYRVYGDFINAISGLVVPPVLNSAWINGAVSRLDPLQAPGPVFDAAGMPVSLTTLQATQQALDAGYAAFKTYVQTPPAGNVNPLEGIVARADYLYGNSQQVIAQAMAQRKTMDAQSQALDAQGAYDTVVSEANALIAQARAFTLSTATTDVQAMVTALAASRVKLVAAADAIRLASPDVYDQQKIKIQQDLSTLDAAIAATQQLALQIDAARGDATSSAAQTYFRSVSDDLQAWSLERDEVYVYRSAALDFLTRLKATADSYAKANVNNRYDGTLQQFSLLQTDLEKAVAWSDGAIEILSSAIGQLQKILSQQNLSLSRPMHPETGKATRPLLPAAIPAPLSGVVEGSAPSVVTGAAPVMTAAPGKPVSTTAPASSVPQSPKKSNPLALATLATVLYNLIS